MSTSNCVPRICQLENVRLSSHSLPMKSITHIPLPEIFAPVDSLFQRQCLRQLGMTVRLFERGVGISNEEVSRSNKPLRSSRVLNFLWPAGLDRLGGHSVSVLESLSTYRYDNVHRRLVEKKQEGTGGWILTEGNFNRWFEETASSCFWCSGIRMWPQIRIGIEIDGDWSSRCRENNPNVSHF